MSRWFRMYDELLDDPKVQKLDAETFKAWINLLALASRNQGKLPPVEDISFALRMDVDAVSTVLSRLLHGGLIESRQGGTDGKHYAPYKWEERQYKSDTSTDRVKRFRKRSKTVTETPPDTDTYTDIPPYNPPKSKKGKGPLPADWKLPAIADLPPKARACAEKWTQASYETEGEGFALYWRSCGRMMKDWDATWANRIIARHEAVMRAQKFGHAAPDGKPVKLSTEQQRKNLEGAIQLYDRMGKREEAAEARRKLSELEAKAA